MEQRGFWKYFPKKIRVGGIVARCSTKNNWGWKNWGYGCKLRRNSHKYRGKKATRGNVMEEKVKNPLASRRGEIQKVFS